MRTVGLGPRQTQRVRCHAVRILVVAEQYPWPAVDGYRQRLHHLVTGLSCAGDVEVLVLDRRSTGGASSGQHRAAAPDGVEITAVPVGDDATLRQWIRPWARDGRPRRVLSPDWSALRTAFEQRLRHGPPVDLIWYSHVDTWFALHDAAASVQGGRPASIVDFDNLEHLALRLRRRTPPRFAPDSSVGQKVRTTGRWAVSRAFDLVDEGRWDRLQKECASAVEHVVVCSELDVERSGCENAVVIGNGASAPDPGDLRTDRTALVATNPTMFFVGALDYEPNTEAVEWFVRDVLPAVRRNHPEACVRIVGRGEDKVAWVGERPGVDLVGPAPVLADEIARADVSIVPIRVGAGTRLKVVEALANHLPLVTTTVGCEGIELTHDVDALIADDAGSFAAACSGLISDGQQRQRLADAGAALFALRYDWTGIESQVGALAERTVQERSRSTAGE